MPLGNKRRVLVLMVLTAGILTFFAPLVTVDPVVSSDVPAKQVTLLSVFKMLRGGYGVPFPTAASYVLMVVALVFVALRLLRSSKVLTNIGLFGGMFSIGRDRGLFRGLHFGRLTVMLLIIWAAILYIGWDEDLDTE